jgi:hypothetical protein
MGDILQVRVMAYTPDVSAVEKQWPELSELAWPPANNYAPAKRGVLELVETLVARLRFEDVPKAKVDALLPDALKAKALIVDMEAALGEWNASQANKISIQIENALTALESRAGMKL